MTTTEFSMAAMSSGECRYLYEGHEDVQVYCRRPFVETGGRSRLGEATYCVVCPDAGLEYGNWQPMEEAAATVDRIVETRGA